MSAGHGRALGIRLQYADARMRALVVNALLEKAEGNRKAADAINVGDKAERADDAGPDRLARQLRDDAELAEQMAEELEGV